MAAVREFCTRRRSVVMATPGPKNPWNGLLSCLLVILLVLQPPQAAARSLQADAPASGRGTLPLDVTKAIYDSLGEIMDLLGSYLHTGEKESTMKVAEGADAIYASAEDIHDATSSNSHSANSIADAITKAPYGQVIVQQDPRHTNTKKPVSLSALAPAQAMSATAAPNHEEYKSFLSDSPALSFAEVETLGPLRPYQASSDSGDLNDDEDTLITAAHEAAHVARTRAKQEPVSHPGWASKGSPPAATSSGGHPWWAGQPIVKVAKRGDASKSQGMPSSNITGIADLQDLDDKQLASIFATGEPDIPGGLPGSRGALISVEIDCLR